MKGGIKKVLRIMTDLCLNFSLPVVLEKNVEAHDYCDNCAAVLGQKILLLIFVKFLFQIPHLEPFYIVY